MKKLIVILIIILTSIFTLNMASATQLYFDPVDQSYNTGDILYYDLYADIDTDDAIMGFGFDLSFDGGATFISGPGDSGSYLTFDNFTGNTAYFYYEPLFDDGDTISGWRALFDPDISGIGILLGTFEFTAHALGLENITLDADDLGPFGIEGLVQGKINGEGFMPNIPIATASPVPIPEPGTIFLLGFGFIGLIGFKKRVLKG